MFLTQPLAQTHTHCSGTFCILPDASALTKAPIPPGHTPTYKPQTWSSCTVLPLIKPSLFWQWILLIEENNSDINRIALMSWAFIFTYCPGVAGDLYFTSPQGYVQSQICSTSSSWQSIPHSFWYICRKEIQRVGLGNFFHFFPLISFVSTRC